jgi:hypothetical protein
MVKPESVVLSEWERQSMALDFVAKLDFGRALSYISGTPDPDELRQIVTVALVEIPSASIAQWAWHIKRHLASFEGDGEPDDTEPDRQLALAAVLALKTSGKRMDAWRSSIEP